MTTRNFEGHHPGPSDVLYRINLLASVERRGWENQYPSLSAVGWWNLSRKYSLSDNESQALQRDFEEALKFLNQHA